MHAHARRDWRRRIPLPRQLRRLRRREAATTRSSRIDGYGAGGAQARALPQRPTAACTCSPRRSPRNRREPSRNAKKRPTRFRLPVVQPAPSVVSSGGELPLLTLTQAAIRPAGVVRLATTTGVEQEALGTAHRVSALGTALLPAIDLEVSRGDDVFW